MERKKSKETGFLYRIRVLSHMLQVGPWNRLGLTIQWLVPKYRVEFEPLLSPPTHMPIAEGRVISKKISSPSKEPTSSFSSQSLLMCDLCHQIMNNDEVLTCLNPNCDMNAHIFCLASHFLKYEPHRMLPLEGSCSKCSCEFLWADLIRKFNGCYQNQSFSLDETILS